MRRAHPVRLSPVLDPSTGHRAGLEEGHGRWIFPVVGSEVTQVQIDHALGLLIDGSGQDPRVHVRISSRLEYGSGDDLVSIDPEATMDLAPLLSLHKATLTEAYALKDGHLVLRFGDGRVIKVAPDDQFEAWHVSGQMPPVERRFEIIAVPGGGVALF